MVRSSNDPDGPAFSWIDITGVGTPIPFTGDDQNQGPFSLPFPFPFYGQTYNTAHVATNGFLNFLAPNASFGNGPIPNPSEPNAAIYPFWDDLFVDGAASGSGETHFG